MGAFFVCKGGGRVNVQGKINNLLKALRQQGIVYKINTQQFYSESQGRLCTKLILWEEHPNLQQNKAAEILGREMEGSE